MNYDKVLISCLISNKNKIRNGIVRKIKSYYPNLHSYLVNRYDDSESLSETIRRIQYNIEERPKCKVCGNKVNYLSNGIYRNVCSFKCGYEYSKDKIANTTIERYGVNNPLKADVIKEKYKNTCIRKYGCDNPSKSDFIKEKKAKTYIEHYGVDNYFKTKESIYKSHSNACISKQIETKKINHTFNSSKQEDELFEYIRNKFPLTQRQYKDDERYPFACDYFIPELNLFIEYQGNWTHGKHAYNKESEEDKILLEKWKSKNTKYYINAIQTWTIRDVNKRNIAKQNNLNYVEFWSILDCKHFLEKL